MHERTLKLPSGAESNLGTFQAVIEDKPAGPLSISKKGSQKIGSHENVALDAVWHSDLRALAKHPPNMPTAAGSIGDRRLVSPPHRRLTDVKYLREAMLLSCPAYLGVLLVFRCGVMDAVHC